MISNNQQRDIAKSNLIETLAKYDGDKLPGIKVCLLRLTRRRGDKEMGRRIDRFSSN